MRWKSLVVLLLSVIAAVSHLNAGPVVEYTSAGTLFDSRPFTLGYEFTISVPFTVDALGYWDDGLGNDHQVGVWNSVGVLLTSTTVLGSDPLTDHFRCRSIPDFLLGPGTYTIGGEFLGNGDLFPFGATGLLTAPGYSWVTDRQLEGSGLNFPTVSTGGSYGENGILAVTFAASGDSVAPIPEPTNIVLLGTGIVLLGLRFIWRASRKSTC